MHNLSSSVQAFATINKLPCSSFVAAYALDQLGKVPTDPTDIDAWYSLDPELWKIVNLWGGEDLLGSADNIYYLKKKLGGKIYHVDGPPLPLSNGVYIVQRWCGSQGHSFLLSVKGNTTTIIDSNTSKGLTFRTVEGSDWFLPGCSHTLLHL